MAIQQVVLLGGLLSLAMMGYIFLSSQSQGEQTSISPPLLSQQLQAKHDIKRLNNALLVYKIDNGVYPTNVQNLSALEYHPIKHPIPKRWNMLGYMKSIPLDPWGQPYQYRRASGGGSVDVYSLGADGALGGSGAATDIR